MNQLDYEHKQFKEFLMSVECTHRANRNPWLLSGPEYGWLYFCLGTAVWWAHQHGWITHEELFIEHAIRGLSSTVCQWPWVSVWLLMSCLSNPWLINEINAKSTPLSYCALWALSPMINALPMALKPLSYGDCWISFIALMFLSFQFQPWLFSIVSSTKCIEPWTLLGFRLPLSLFLYAKQHPI